RRPARAQPRPDRLHLVVEDAHFGHGIRDVGGGQSRQTRGERLVRALKVPPYLAESGMADLGRAAAFHDDLLDHLCGETARRYAVTSESLFSEGAPLTAFRPPRAASTPRARTGRGSRPGSSPARR